MCRSDQFADVSLNQWMALTPPELVQAHLNLDGATLAALSEDKPVIVRSAARRPPRDALPEWPTGTIGVPSTVNQAPHAIPVTGPLRASDRRIIFSLKRDRGSLARLREQPDVALAILAQDVAFTARGRARVIEESMASAPEFAAVLLDVQDIDDHRQAAEVVESGVAVRFTDAAAQRGAKEHVAALRELADRVA
jgi:hypothetical protein